MQFDTMTTDATVSVILPTYERGDVVGGAIKSILAQTYSSFDVLVVDGGSTDETRAVVESFDDTRVRYLRRSEPAGPSAARNAGVRATESEFVAFIDSDDRWPSDKLHRQVKAIRTSEAAAVAYTGVSKGEGEPRTRDGVSGDAEQAVKEMAVPTYTSTLMIRRGVFEQVDGFDESLPCFEDWDLCLRLAADHDFRYVPDTTVEKGTPGDSISGRPDRLSAAVQRLCRKHELPDDTIARLLADVGITSIEAGAFENGRFHLRRALQHDPYQPKAAIAAGLSLLGSSLAFNTGMEWLYAVERQLTD